MDEDKEIELLLKSNEDMLLEAANSSHKDGSFKGSSCGTDIYGKNGNVLESDNENIYGKITTEGSANNKSQQLDSGDEVQELLDYQMVSLMCNNPNKYYLTVLTQDSDEESTSSEDSDCSNVENNYFFDEIMDDEESSFRGRDTEKTKKQVGRSNSKQQSMHKIITTNELSDLQRLNLERNVLLTKLETKLQQDLRENEEKQWKTRDSIANLSVTDSKKCRDPSLTRCYFKKFGMPYFKDCFRFTPPPNEDQTKKLERGELIVSKIPRVQHWIKNHRNMLMDAIRDTILEERSTNLINKIVKFKKSLDSSKDDNENLVLEQNIDKLEDELRLTRSKTYSELVAEEADDREYDWMKYSVSIFNNLHSSEECRRYWHNYLKPSVNKAKWERNEDSKLSEIANQMQYQNWDTIAELLGTNRTAYQCFVHFQTRLHATQNYSVGKWTKEEDNKLLGIINSAKIGEFIPWSKVSAHMPMRTHAQIYNRWINCLNPKLVKGKFTKEEDLFIVSGIEVFGVSYKQMATLMKNRSSSQIRERYERHLLPKTGKIGSWALKEDEKLLSLVKKYGERNWAAISKEMKTRSRTQARQRYSFMKKMMAKQPGWDIAQVKRINCNNTSKETLKTQKLVDKLKKDIDQVEKDFKLSKLESDTFRIEKLKELKDRILLRKFDLKNKKRGCSEDSTINNLLLDYFKHTKVKAIGKPFKVGNPSEYSSYLNEILVLAKYFGHKLKIPDDKEEILSNNRLDPNLSNILCNTIDSRGSGLAQTSTDESYFNSSAVNIDYVEPEFDDSILMNEWWHTPLVDIKKFNFSEFLKPTVFDYSHGMHRDICDSKTNRSAFPYFTTQNNSATVTEQTLHQQPIYIPCNYLTTLGLRSLILSKSRLKRDTSHKNSHKNNEKYSNNEEIQSDNELNQYLLSQFQDTMNTLFTWPKILSQTSVSSTPVIRIESNQKRRNQVPYELLDSMTSAIENSQISSQQQRGKVRDTVLNQSETCEFESQEHKEYKSGVRCYRKIKTEHDLQKRSSTITYSKIQIAPKRCLYSSDTCEPQVKVKKKEKFKVKVVKHINGREEVCAEVPSILSREPQKLGVLKLSEKYNEKEKSGDDGIESCLQDSSDNTV